MIRVIISYSLIIFSLALSIALGTFSPNDLVDLSSPANYQVVNWLGRGGAKVAEAFILFYGQTSWLWSFFSLIVGLRLIFGILPKNLLSCFFSMQYLSILSSIFLSCFYRSESYLSGGIFGAVAYRTLNGIFPDAILQVFFGLLLMTSLGMLWKLPRTLWKKWIEYRQTVPKQKQWTDAEEWIYVGEQPVEVFEEPVAYSEQGDDMVYLNKRRLTYPEDPSFLRDVDVDLTAPYKRCPDPFYDVLEENRLELDDMPEIPTQYTVSPDSLDELENVKVFRIPAIEQIEETKKYIPQLPDYGNRTEDFVKPMHRAVRLSFDKGFIDSVSCEQETTQYLKNTEYNIRCTQEESTELDNEVYPVNAPVAASRDELVADGQYVQTLSLSDNAVDVDKLVLKKEILLDEYGFYKGEQSVQQFSEEEITDPHCLILSEIVEPQQNIHNFSVDVRKVQELTEIENQLVSDWEGKNNQKVQQKYDFQKKIMKKQKELADRYYQLYVLNEQEKDLVRQLESDMQRKYQCQQKLREKLNRKQQELARVYNRQQSTQGEVVFDELTDQDDTQIVYGKDNIFSIFSNRGTIEELGDEIRLLKEADRPVSGSEVQKVPISVFDDFFLEQDRMPVAIPEYDFADSVSEGDVFPDEHHVSETAEISVDLLNEMMMPDPSNDYQLTFVEITDVVNNDEREKEDIIVVVPEEENGSFGLSGEKAVLDLDEQNSLNPSVQGEPHSLMELPVTGSTVSEKMIERFVPIAEEIPKLISEISDLDQNDTDLLPEFSTQIHFSAADEYPNQHLVSEVKTSEIIFPRVEDLDPNLEIVSHELEDQEIEETIRMIEDTFESFNISMKVVDYSRGPAITRFELEPPSGLKLRTIRNLQDDLALQAGTSNIRIISPVEGRSYIGIEIPNKIRRQFLLREFIESPEFQKSEADLPLILGTDIGGKVLVSDLATTPHLLVAGTTGSGKSVYINALIMGLLFKLSADDLKFIMIDPKMVELELYNGIPHLLAPIITKPEEAMAALEWAVNEMDRRYRILSENSVRNIKEYQSLEEDSLFGTEESGYEKLPYIVIIVDEFANLMLRSPKDTEKNISRLAAMARAVGMHLVVATQRPSVDVVTGVIKANFPCRVAFRVSSKIDSRTILDRNGAESLLGRGDMLFMSPEHMDTVRIQSPYVSGQDVETVVNTVKQNGSPDYAIDFEELLSTYKENTQDGFKTDALSDPLFAEVLRYAVDSREISASAVQRRFRVGYNRASRLIETMKDLNIITSPTSAGKGWQVRISKDEIADYVDF